MAELRQDSLSDVAYEHILERINSFVYKPNDPIIEADICQELSISRTPLREALRRLEAEGLVTKVRNRGTFVRGYTQEDIVESSDIRTLFEIYALQRCMKRLDRDRLEAVRKKLLALTEESVPEEYYASDMALHDLITSYCMNTRMLSILRSLDAQLGAIRRISAQTPNRLRQSRAEHLQIVDAIEQGALELATEILSRHLENVKESCIQVYQKIRMEYLQQ